METKIVYCELEFLRIFLNKYPFTFEYQHCWHNSFSFLSKSKIVFNTSKKDLWKEFESNQLFKYMVKRSQEGKNQGKQRWSYLDEALFPDIKSCQVSSFFTEKNLTMTSMILTNTDNVVCKRIMRKYGILTYNVDTLLDANYLYYDSGTALPDDAHKLNGWSSILNQREINICNSLVIIDNYLLQSNSYQNYASKSVNEKIENNLIPILEALLPKKTDIPFHITIFAIEGNEPFETTLKNIQDKISSLRGGAVTINLQICKCEEKGEHFHDRVLITNNIWISSGIGFDMFGNNGYQVTKPTSISVLFPFIQTSANWAEKAYENTISYARHLAETNIKYGELFNNRLITF